MALPDDLRFIIADTETTDAEEGRKACEIGWIEIDESWNILDQREAILDPERMINPSAAGIHGLTNKICEQYPTIEEYFSLAHEKCYGRPIQGPIALIGHKIAFDRPMLEPFVAGGVAQEVCTLRWARRLYPFADDHKLSSLIYSLNLPTPEGPLAQDVTERYSGGHRVFGDVWFAMQLAKHCCERTGLSLRELAEESAKEFYVEVMPMGKHKGKDMAWVGENDKGYLRWMQGNMEMDPDLKYTVETTLKKKKNNE